MTTPIERLVEWGRRVAYWNGRNDPLTYEEVCNNLRSAVDVFKPPKNTERSCATCACWEPNNSERAWGFCHRNPPPWKEANPDDWCHDGYVAKGGA